MPGISVILIVDLAISLVLSQFSACIVQRHPNVIGRHPESCRYFLDVGKILDHCKSPILFRAGHADPGPSLSVPAALTGRGNIICRTAFANGTRPTPIPETATIY